ncbi:hypothetical protein MHYP_G00025160 [Metynnis hypsauchen]
MNTSTFYGKRAQLHVRPPPEDSDDSCLYDSAGSDEEYLPKPDGDGSSSEEEVVPSIGQAARQKKKRPNKEKVAWKTVKQTQSSAKNVPMCQGVLPDNDSIRLPIEYFRQFFDTELLTLIVNQSNLYSTQENPNHALKLDQKELEQFIGTVLYMSVIRLPRSRIYWSNARRVDHVANVMPHDRWEEIKHCIHFSDNMAPNTSDRLFKIRPLIDSLLTKFQALPQEQMMSIDEQMVPFKGRSVLKQYIPKKPYKWGYKIFVLCDTKGLVHSFDVYAGKSDPPPGSEDIGASGNVVLKLAQVIEGSVNHLLYFDNWFSSLDLFVALAKRRIPALGTVRQNRLRDCSFSKDETLKKKGRGTFKEQQAVIDTGAVVGWWLGNQPCNRKVAGSIPMADSP